MAGHLTHDVSLRMPFDGPARGGQAGRAPVFQPGPRGIRRGRNTRKDAVTYTGAFGVRRTPNSVPAVLPRSVVRRSSGRRHDGPAKECHRWAHTRVGVGRPLEAAPPRAVGLLKTRVQRVAGSSQFDRTAAIGPEAARRERPVYGTPGVSVNGITAVDRKRDASDEVGSARSEKDGCTNDFVGFPPTLGGCAGKDFVIHR